MSMLDMVDGFVIVCDKYTIGLCFVIEAFLILENNQFLFLMYGNFIKKK